MKRVVLKSLACATAVALLGMSKISFAAGTNSVSVSYRANGDTEATVCYIYNEGGYDASHEACAPGFGSIQLKNASLDGSYLLTLGAMINEHPNTMVHINLDALTNVKAATNIATTIDNIGAGNLQFDFEGYSFTDKGAVVNKADTEKTMSDFGEKLIIKSGKFALATELKDLQIDGGEVNFGTEKLISEDFTMNGGKLISGGVSALNFSMKGGEIESKGAGILAQNTLLMLGGEIDIFNFSDGVAVQTVDGDLEIDGGKISGKEVLNGLASDNGKVIIKGGEIELLSDATGEGSIGIFAGENGSISFEGGKVTTDGFENGIVGHKNKIYFKGGTTTVNNSKLHTVIIVEAEDPENDLKFGENMGIKEYVDVYYSKEKKVTGIDKANTVTIGEGFRLNKKEGEETDYGEEVPTAPDTGDMTGEAKSAIIIASIAALPISLFVLYIINFIRKRNSQRVKF